MDWIQIRRGDRTSAALESVAAQGEQLLGIINGSIG